MSTPTRQAVNGEIKDLQIYSCCYNPLRRKDTMNLVNIYCFKFLRQSLKLFLYWIDITPSYYKCYWFNS